MTPLIPSWEDRYRWLVGHHECLRLKAQDGEYDPDEWHDLIKQMKGIGLHAMANDLRREMEEPLRSVLFLLAVAVAHDPPISVKLSGKDAKILHDHITEMTNYTERGSDER